MSKIKNNGANLDALQGRIGHSFADLALLQRALTHSSIAADANNERLEFLGDRVLNLIVAEALYNKYATEKEGDLARRHAALVQASMLTKTAIALGLGDALHMSEAEETAGGRANDNILADAMEATLGALFLDAGIEVCRSLILRLWDEDFTIMVQPPRDAKTALQEWAQARGLKLPAYILIARDGPDHAPRFRVEVKVEGFPAVHCEGASLRKAEKEAAALLLAQLES